MATSDTYTLAQAEEDIATLRGQVDALEEFIPAIGGGGLYFVNGVLTAVDPVNGGPETWHSMSLSISGWSDNSGTGKGVRVKLLPGNIVALQLNLNITTGSTTTDGSTICTLPASAYYPATLQPIPGTAAKNSASGSQTPHFDITTAGAIRCWGISSGQAVGCSATYPLD